MPEMILVWKRVVLLHEAHAKICQLARTWGVIIGGFIGHNSYRVCEVYDIYHYAVDREQDINSEGQAVVSSIEEVLFPQGYPILKHLPKTVAISARIPGISVDVKPLHPLLLAEYPKAAQRI